MTLRLLIAFCLIHVTTLLAAPTLAEDRPNIVWIFVEDMNGWYGCYGDDTVPTPNIDALAARGVRFDRAYMPAGVCSATRSAIATGAMQTSLGIHNHRSSRKRVPEEVIHLPDGVKTVYQLMREAGYHVTSNTGKNDFNFIFSTKELYDQMGKGMGLSDNHWRNRPEGKPFFAQIQLRGGKNSGKGFAKTDPAKVKVAPYYPDHEIIRGEYAHHYDTIRQTDAEVGGIIAALKEDGLLDNTIVIYWTDHGMRLHRHKQWLYEGGIRVPLVIAGPGIDQGASRDDLINGIDISATTLGIAGVDLDKHSWIEGQDFFAKDHEPRGFVISARDRCDYTIDRVRAVTTKKYKYLRNFLTDRTFMQPQYRDGRPHMEVCRQLFKEGKLDEVQAFKWNARVPEELYDLENDPHEINNLADDPEYAKALAEHRAILEKWIKDTDDKGQYPESVDSLRGVLKRWSKQAVNPEYEKAR
ncbi:MAG: sulfatase [Phycisphaeraceae bacterium]|nr:sulfatase [Phycisphaeraceae bacterium]